MGRTLAEDVTTEGKQRHIGGNFGAYLGLGLLWSPIHTGACESLELGRIVALPKLGLPVDSRIDGVKYMRNTGQ